MGPADLFCKSLPPFPFDLTGEAVVLNTVEKAAGALLSDFADSCSIGELVVLSGAFYLADRGVFAVLLVEKRYARDPALITQRAPPLRVHRPCLRAALTPDNHPIHATSIKTQR